MSKLCTAEKIKEDNLLLQAIMRYSKRMNNNRYEDKPKLEQEIDGLFSGLHLHLEKHKDWLAEGQPEAGHPEPSPKDEMASKLLETYNNVSQGAVSVSDGVADDLGKICDLVNVAKTAKTLANDTAIRSKLKEI